MQTKKLLLTTGLIVSITGFTNAQGLGPSVIDASGGSTTSAGIMHDYAVGQIVAGDAYTANGLIVTPGVLQPNFNPTGVSPQLISAAELQVYPNPVSSSLFLQPAFAGGGMLQYTLYDGIGRQVLQQEVLLANGSERQTMEVATLPTGQYLLRVQWYHHGQISESGYKVQKIK